MRIRWLMSRKIREGVLVIEDKGCLSACGAANGLNVPDGLGTPTSTELHEKFMHGWV
jgi:hypothetical protein